MHHRAPQHRLFSVRPRRARGVAASGRIPSARGFTILEVAIALLLIGLLLGISIPAINGMSGAYLRTTTGRMQGAIRDTFARTALSGNSHRLVFDMEQSAWWVEGTTGGVVLKRERITLDPDGFGKLVPLNADKLEGVDLDTDDEEEKAKIQLYAPATWQPVDDEIGKPQKLHPDIRFFSVWAEHLEEAAKGGQVTVTFFPGGYVEEAHITLTDDDVGDRTLTVVTRPLTGETRVLDEIPNVPDID